MMGVYILPKIHSQKKKKNEYAFKNISANYWKRNDSFPNFQLGSEVAIKALFNLQASTQLTNPKCI